MAGSSDLTIEAVANNLQFILPGVMGGVIIYLTVRKVNHVAALPLGILLELFLFALSPINAKPMLALVILS